MGRIRGKNGSKNRPRTLRNHGIEENKADRRELPRIFRSVRREARVPAGDFVPGKPKFANLSGEFPIPQASHGVFLHPFLMKFR
ncbi:MAG: hypothetical protein RLZZ232_2742 [Planctomycetota bacterium]|jgi:hypothetical protein